MQDARFEDTPVQAVLQVEPQAPGNCGSPVQ
jgi:hypothetical protein